MESQHLKNRLTEIQGHIDDFERKLIDSENTYQKALELLTDLKLRSSLMEQHIIHTERQKLSVAKMEVLYKEVQDKLASIDDSNL